MASAAEQLAANVNWSAFSKAEELQKRIWFTLGALIVYRLGTYIPLPGIDPVQLARIMEQQTQGLLGMFNMLSGGAIERMAIFALNVMPYISASIIVQLMTTVSPTLEALKKEGEAGRKTINQYTRYLTVVLAVVQSFGIARGLESNPGLVINPGIFFEVSTVITLTGGVMFLMWLGEQITSRGIGNGVSLIIFAGIVANLLQGFVNTLEMARTGSICWFSAIALYCARRRGDHLHRLCGARAAPAVGAVPQAPGRQPHVRRRKLASAAEAEHVGRHPADLRLVAAACCRSRSRSSTPRTRPNG